MTHISGAAPVADRSSSAVLALLSGYPSRLRLEKPLAFLEVYSDDSASDVGDRRLFFAGYLNSAQAWALFSDAWGECLRSDPKIEYLKMVEANGLRGQFGGRSGSERDEKLRRLSFIIAHFRPLSFSFSVSRKEFDEELGGVIPRGLNAHFISAFGIVSGIVRYLENSRVETPVKFIFDSQDGVDVDIHLFLDWMVRHLSPKARRLINQHPSFEDDITLMPLQAADMLAWHLRRNHERGDCDKEMLDRLIGDLYLNSGLDISQLRDWRLEFSRLPMVSEMQSKTDWRRLRGGISRLKADGYRFPYGSRWKNAKYLTKDWISRSRWKLGRYFDSLRRK